jgi:hypothetical protein
MLLSLWNVTVALEVLVGKITHAGRGVLIVFNTVRWAPRYISDDVVVLHPQSTVPMARHWPELSIELTTFYYPCAQT